MEAKRFVELLRGSGFGPFTGVPCSVFKHLLNYLETSEAGTYLGATSEGEAMGLAGGFALSGKTPVVIMQVDGYGNAVNPLSSLQLLYGLPCLMLISWRGEPGKTDAPQHAVMGKAIRPLLDLFAIPHQIAPQSEGALAATLEKARHQSESARSPVALIVPKGFFAPFISETNSPAPSLPLRIDCLNIIDSIAEDGTRFVGTTGFGGREMHQALAHRKRFYMMGSMGCALAIGLALALEKAESPVMVLDGDGALMMKMGTLVTAGALKPPNLIHLCFDNGCYESTGGQKSASEAVDLAAVTRACGYASAATVSDGDALARHLDNLAGCAGPHFLRVRIRPGTSPELPRPTQSPKQIKAAFMAAGV